MITDAQIVTYGPFGRAVGVHLATLRPSLETVSLTLGCEVEAGKVDVRLLAAWRPEVDACLRMDAASHRDGRVFLPLVVDDSMLVVGPLVIPGRSACWHCYHRRMRQHAIWPAHRAALAAHYEQHPETGPRGYLEAFAMLGAARLAQMLAAIETGDARGGEVWELDLLTRETAVSTVVGIDACPRCGLGRDPADRSTRELRRALEYLWR
jgi:bacteriocin biosynthesis cyclodehydratase domain-containing protein